jgi:choline kinase
MVKVRVLQSFKDKELKKKGLEVEYKPNQEIWLPFDIERIENLKKGRKIDILEKKSSKSQKRYIIMADGKAKRWNNHTGRPKHLIEIEGEPLLYRTVRLLKKHSVEDIYITSHNKDYDIVGTTRYEPINNVYEIDRFYACQPIWARETIFIYGDVYYTEEAIKKIVNDKSKTFRYFGRSKASKKGKDHAELFAIKISESNLEKFKEVCLQIRNEVEKGEHKKGLGWHTYLDMIGKDHNITIDELREYLGKNKLSNFTEINDETDDFDWAKDYDNFVSKK